MVSYLPKEREKGRERRTYTWMNGEKSSFPFVIVKSDGGVVAHYLLTDVIKMALQVNGQPTRTLNLLPLLGTSLFRPPKTLLRGQVMVLFTYIHTHMYTACKKDPFTWATWLPPVACKYNPPLVFRVSSREALILLVDLTAILGHWLCYDYDHVLPMNSELLHRGYHVRTA